MELKWHKFLLKANHEKRLRDCTALVVVCLTNSLVFWICSNKSKFSDGGHDLCEHYATCRGYVTALYLAPIFVTRGIARKRVLCWHGPTKS